jgi:hypothetical protein
MLLKIGIITLAGVLCLFTLVALAVYQSGIFVVDFHDRAQNRHIYAPVPMFFVNLAMDMVPDYKLQNWSTRLHAEPSVLQSMGQHLSDCPDGVFLEVQNRDGHARVEKIGDTLIVHADGTDKSFDMRVPITSTTRAITKVANAVEASKY